MLRARSSERSSRPDGPGRWRGHSRASARRYVYPALLLALTLHGAAAAQSTTAIDPVVVSASRIAAPLSRTAADVTVIERAQIEASGAASAIDLLRQVPGLHIDRPGGRGSVSSVYVRGGDPNFVLVLIDGVKVNDPTNSRGGSFDFSSLEISRIERIEVVRGPLSAVYGSDAISGVINIVTRAGSPNPTVSVEAGAGRHTERHVNGEYTGRLAGGEVALTLADVDAGEPVPGSAFSSRSVGLGWNGEVLAGSLARLNLRFADNDAQSFPDDSGGPRFAALRDVDRRDSRELSAAAELRHELGPRASFTFAASLYDRDEAVRSPGVAPGARDPFGIPPNRSRSDFRRTELAASATLTPLDALGLNVGMNAEFQSGEASDILLLGPVEARSTFEESRTILSPFIEARLRASDALTLSAGLRADKPDDEKLELSPRAGALYRFSGTDTRVRLNWGEGFKLPSFFALSNAIVGNPDLVAETGESLELGVSQPLGETGASLGFGVFHNRFFDVIDFDPGPPPRLVNRSEVVTRGGELTASIALGESAEVDAHASFADTDIRGTDQELRDRPRWRGGLSLRWRPRSDVRLGASALYVGTLRDSSIPTGDETLEAYLRLDASARWEPVPDVVLSAAIDNLLDADYEEAVGFPAPGITPRFSIRVRFR